jgi:excisionase family DNA binding protein
MKMLQEFSTKMSDTLAAAFFGRPSSLFQKLSRGESRFLPTKKAAEYLGVSVWTLRNHVHEGRLSYIPGGKWRYDRRDLDRFLETSKEKELVI